MEAMVYFTLAQDQDKNVYFDFTVSNDLQAFNLLIGDLVGMNVTFKVLTAMKKIEVNHAQR
jgi:hypothetical protein